MSQEAWQMLRPDVLRVFHQQACDSGYETAAQAADPEVVSAINERAKVDGVLDELLGMISPAAKGNFVLFYSASFSDFSSQN